MICPFKSAALNNTVNILQDPRYKARPGNEATPNLFQELFLGEIFGVLAHTGPRPDTLDDKQFKRRCKFDKRLIDDIMEEQSNICQIIFFTNTRFSIIQRHSDK